MPDNLAPSPEYISVLRFKRSWFIRPKFYGKQFLFANASKIG